MKKKKKSYLVQTWYFKETSLFIKYAYVNKPVSDDTFGFIKYIRSIFNTIKKVRNQLY